MSQVCNDWGRARARAAAHTGRDKDHVRTLQALGDSCPGLLGRFLADVRLGAGAHAAGQLFTDLKLVGALGLVEVLLIGIDSDKIHTGDAACDHSVNNIISGAADANNLNIYNFFFKRFGHMLSSYVLIFYLSHAKPNCRRIIYKRG